MEGCGGTRLALRNSCLAEAHGAPATRSLSISYASFPFAIFSEPPSYTVSQANVAPTQLLSSSF